MSLHAPLLVPSLGTLAAALAVWPVLAQPGSTGTEATGQARATVVQPISATALADLSFGAITVGTGEGTVLVPADGSSAAYGGSVRQTCAGAAACQPHPARFAVRGEPQRAWRIAVPDTVLAQGSHTGTMLPVTGLTPDSGTARRLDAMGTGEFTIGGTLGVPRGTPPDTYRAEFPVIVSYE